MELIKFTQNIANISCLLKKKTKVIVYQPVLFGEQDANFTIIGLI